jgi:hypothetical protein
LTGIPSTLFRVPEQRRNTSQRARREVCFGPQAVAVNLLDNFVDLGEKRW